MHADELQAAERGASTLDRLGSGHVVSQGLVDFLASYDPGVEVVAGVFKAAHVYALTAKTGHAKTAIKTRLEMCVATGTPFAGREVSKGKVLSLVLENPDDQKPRYKAEQEYFGIDGTSQIRIIDRIPGLAMALEDIRADAAIHGPYVLVTVDTSAAAFSGVDENDNVQARQHAADLRELTLLPGRPCVLALCHPTKGANVDSLLPRGGGAFLNEIDGNLTLWRDGERVTMHWLGKFRGQQFDPILFRLEQIGLATYKDAKGRPIRTVIAVPIDDHEAEQLTRADWNNENRVLYAMRTVPDGSLAEWASECGWVSDAGTPAKTKVHRILEGLNTDKLVRKERRKWVLTESGKRAAELVK